MVAQSLLLFIVFRSRDRENRTGASRFDHVANAHGLACARISDDHMPGTLVPGGTQHRLKTFFECVLDEDLFAKEGMGHGSGSSRSVRIRNVRTGPSGSASGTAGGSGAT